MKISDEIITSRQNRIVVEAIKLSEKKARDAAGLFRFDGLKLFDEALDKGVEIVRVLLSASKSDALIDKINAKKQLPDGVPVTLLSDDIFAKVSEENAPEGVICIAGYPKKHVRNASLAEIEKAALDKSSRVMLLESVRDPGNVGTIMRSAAAFGIDTLILSRDCADVYNPKTVRGAMGALFKLKVLTVDKIETAIEALTAGGRKVYAAALDRNALKLNEVCFDKNDAVVIGNEGHGLSDNAIKACTKSLYIPMEEGSESLNAAIAASVIMWNMYK